MKPFVAHAEGNVLVPDEPVDLPRGITFRVSLEPIEAEGSQDISLRDFLLKFAGTAKGEYPRDLARNHDHYLHGRPKR